MALWKRTNGTAAEPRMGTIRVATLAAAVAVAVAGCGGSDAPVPTASVSATAAATDSEQPSIASATLARGAGGAKDPATPPRDPTVVVVTTSAGAFKVRLHDDRVPRTVENFLENYVDRGFYDQTVVHHVEPGFMVAMGGYSAEMKAKPTRAWIRNESKNSAANRRGTLAMARHPDYPHSATSQFFINLVDNPSLDFRAPAAGDVTEDAYGYCVFGDVIEGMDVVDRLAESPTRAAEEFPAVPVTPIRIESVARVR
ncbi:MAG: peptidyl-prolyl cis-trans isomerase [Planctomycetes bacterium]|nr:peptidyl-prolyl cis-trans isomerase [Planctomycetota bacterium]